MREWPRNARGTRLPQKAYQQVGAYLPSDAGSVSYNSSRLARPAQAGSVLMVRWSTGESPAPKGDSFQPRLSRSVSCSGVGLGPMCEGKSPERAIQEISIRDRP